ncbi:hypothetical protein [Arthrobacter sp. TE12232]
MMTEASTTSLRPAHELLKKVKQRYMKPCDFNALHINTTWNLRDHIEARGRAANAGRIEVVGPTDYPNIDIRPWPSRRTVAEQIEGLLGSPAMATGYASPYN